MPKPMPTRMLPVIETLRVFSTEMVVVLRGMRRNIGASKLILCLQEICIPYSYVYAGREKKPIGMKGVPEI